MPGKMLSTIYGPVLPSGAAEPYRKTCESTSEICLHMRFHHPIDMAQEMLHLAVILQEPDYRGIRSGKAAVLLIASGIMDIAAIEHISPAIAGIVLGQPFLV